MSMNWSISVAFDDEFGSLILSSPWSCDWWYSWSIALYLPWSLSMPIIIIPISSTTIFSGSIDFILITLSLLLIYFSLKKNQDLTYNNNACRSLVLLIKIRKKYWSSLSSQFQVKFHFISNLKYRYFTETIIILWIHDLDFSSHWFRYDLSMRARLWSN